MLKTFAIALSCLFVPFLFSNLLAMEPHWFVSKRSIDPCGISSYLMTQPVNGEACTVRSLHIVSGWGRRSASTDSFLSKWEESITARLVLTKLFTQHSAVIMAPFSKVLLPGAPRSAASQMWHHQRIKACEPRMAATDAAFRCPLLTEDALWKWFSQFKRPVCSLLCVQSTVYQHNFANTFVLPNVAFFFMTYFGAQFAYGYSV